MPMEGSHSSKNLSRWKRKEKERASFSLWRTDKASRNSKNTKIKAEKVVKETKATHCNTPPQFVLCFCTRSAIVFVFEIFHCHVYLIFNFLGVDCFSQICTNWYLAYCLFSLFLTPILVERQHCILFPKYPKSNSLSANPTLPPLLLLSILILSFSVFSANFNICLFA